MAYSMTTARIMDFLAGRKDKMDEAFNATLSGKIGVNDRVRRRRDGSLGTVWQTGTMSDPNTGWTIPSLSVKHDDGTLAELVPAEEYTKATRY